MIEALHGTIISVEPNRLIISTGPMDLSCIISLTSSSYYGSLQSLEKENATVYTHLHHKEDLMELYGFSTRDERAMFYELVKVQGIGPKQAVRILSGITVDELVRALDQSDLDRLVKIPGLGKKTAQKLVLALRNKLEVFAPEQTRSVKSKDALPEICEEIIHALIEMGYDRKLTRTVVKENYLQLSSTIDNDKKLEEQLFKASIIQLA